MPINNDRKNYYQSKNRYLMNSINILIILLLSTFIPECSTTPLTTKINNKFAFSQSKSITIMRFSSQGATLKYTHNADSLGIILASLLHKKLEKRAKSFKVFLESLDTTTTDLVLEGRFTNIDEGNTTARVMLGTGSVTIAIEGQIRESNGTSVAEFNANKTSSGGLLGMGGLLAADSDTIISNLIEEISEELADFIVKQASRK